MAASVPPIFVLDKRVIRHGRPRVNGIQLAQLLKPAPTAILPTGRADCYDPEPDVIRLSEATWYGVSPEALAHAAHECGHAIQRHARTRTWRVWRLLPVTAPLWWVSVAYSAVSWMRGDAWLAWLFAAWAAFLSLVRWLTVLALEKEASVIALQCLTRNARASLGIDLVRARAELRRNLRTYATR